MSETRESLPQVPPVLQSRADTLKYHIIPDYAYTTWPYYVHSQRNFTEGNFQPSVVSLGKRSYRNDDEECGHVGDGKRRRKGESLTGGVTREAPLTGILHGGSGWVTEMPLHYWPTRDEAASYTDSERATRRPLHCKPTTNHVSSASSSGQSVSERQCGQRSAPQMSNTRPFLATLARLGKRRASVLAQEIKQLNGSRFPMDKMAEVFANKMISDQMSVESRNSDAAVHDCIDVAVMLRSLINDLRQSISNPSRELMEELANFDKLSQSFGLTNAVNHLDFIDQCISRVCTELSKKTEKHS